MKKIHEIIRDENALVEFIEWLPELKENERFFLCLQARKKYLPSLKSSDKTQLKRFVAGKFNLLNKIRQLECPVGSYLTKEGEVIPDEAIALYITLSPRNMRDATFLAAQKLVALIKKHEQNQNDMNPHSEVLSCIHKSKAKASFVHFDIDKPDGSNNSPKCDLDIKSIYDVVEKIVGEKSISIIETRGGCHLMINPDQVVSEKKNWFLDVKNNIDCDQQGDLMVPVVGCCHGGFVPKFYKQG